MKVFLTGATGFVGQSVVDKLVTGGHDVRCLVRKDGDAALLPDNVETLVGDVLKPDSFADGLKDIDAVIHLVGIIDEKKSAGITFERLHVDATRNVSEAAANEGVRHFILMSANGAKEDGVSRYQTTKWDAEQIVKDTGFEAWTIFRPSFMFGDPGPDNPEFITRLATTLIEPFPILPVFGDGLYKLQPIAVDEVASAFEKALTTTAAENRSYVAVGKESYTYNQVLDIITEACGLPIKKKIHQPIFLARPLVHTVGRLGLLPISPDQFEMLLEGNTGNPTAFYHDFNLQPTPFNQDSLAYVQKYI